MRFLGPLARVAAAVITLIAAVEARAESKLALAHATVEACSRSPFDVEKLSSMLSDLGWVTIKYENFSEAHFRSYAAVKLIADTPISPSHDYWKRAWSKSFAAASRIEQIDASRNFNPDRRFFTAPENDGFLSAGVVDGKRGVQDSVLFCTFVAKPSLTMAKYQQNPDPFSRQSTLPIVRLRDETTDDPFAIRRRTSIFLIKTEQVERLIETEFPYVSFVSIDQLQRKTR